MILHYHCHSILMLHDLAPWMTLRALQEHNGKRGHVSGFDAQRSRYEVRLEDEPQVIHVRPENLTQQCSVKASPLSGSMWIQWGTPQMFQDG